LISTPSLLKMPTLAATPCSTLACPETMHAEMVISPPPPVVWKCTSRTAGSGPPGGNGFMQASE